MADEFDDKDIKTALNAWRESVDKHADRQEWFWARQRARIAARMQQSHARRLPALAWAGIAATVAVAVALVVPGDKSTSSNPTVASNTPAHVETQMSDHELMQQLQETMNENVPDALQPGSKLAQAMENAYRSTTVSKAKESTQ